MKNRRLAFPLVALLLLLAPCLKADSNIRIVNLSFVQGDVSIDQGTGHGFKHAVMNMPVTSTTQVRTGDDGLAEVQFEDGSTLRIIGNTSVVFQPLSLTEKGIRISGMSVPEGTVYIHVLNTKHDRFLLKARDLELSVSQGSHLRVSADKAQTLVAVFHGDLMDPDTGLDVGKNQSLRIDNQANAISDVAKGIDPFATDAWDTEREKYHQNPSLYPSLATDSVAFAPPSVPMIGCSYGMMLGSYGVYSPGCVGMGFSQPFDPLYAGLWSPFGLDPMMFGYDAFDYGYGYGYPLGYGYGGYGYAPYGYGGTPTATGLRNQPKPSPSHTTRPMQATAFPRTAVRLPSNVRGVLAGRSAVHAGFASMNRGPLSASGYSMGRSAAMAQWRPFTPSRAMYAARMPGGMGRPGMYGGGYAGGGGSLPAASPSSMSSATRMGGMSHGSAPVGRPGR